MPHSLQDLMCISQELEAERQARSKSEKQRGTLARELDDLGERLDEAGKCRIILRRSFVS